MEYGINYREMDNLIIISLGQLSYSEVAIIIYKKMTRVSFSKSDYLYLYTVSNRNDWFCVIIKKAGNSRMYNITSRLNRTLKGR
jgi:hypothetical protein